MRHVRAVGLVAILASSFSGCNCTYENSVDVPGPVDAFDPVAAVPAVMQYAGPGSQLISMEVLHCPSTGTIDLEAPYYPGWTIPVRYHLVRPTQATVDPGLPVGARPALAPTEAVEVTVMKPHWRNITTNTSETYEKHRGMLAEVGHGSVDDAPVPPPACPLAQLWTRARERGAPPDAVATITYDTSGYHFVIPNTSVDLRFGMACQ